MRRFYKTLPALLATAAVILLIQGVTKVSGATTSSGDDQESSLQKCCELGTSWAQQKLRCEKFTGPVSGVATADQPACLETVEICCRKVGVENECDLGKADARAGLECSGSEDSGSNKKSSKGPVDFRRDCCEGCKLGLMTGSKGKGCSFKKLVLGAPWDSAFTDCCKESKTTTQQLTTSTKAISTSTSNTTPEKDELDYEDITDPTFDVSSSVDLCKLMKGLLCSEICIPTPGSYICNCHEGSKLQPDGRTCVSNATTTIASPTTPLKKTTITKATKSSTIITTASKPKTTKAQSKITKRSTVKTTTKSATKKSSPTTKATRTTRAISPSTLKKVKSRTTRSASSENNELNLPCPAGYRYTSSDETCDDIDECAEESSSACPTGFNCVNTIGSYRCEDNSTQLNPEDQHCELGYRWNSTSEQCDDVDECLENTHKCLIESENCRNLDGSYECEIKCEYGFIFNGHFGACLDVNECTELTNVCPQIDTICINTLGSFECKNINEYQQPFDPNYAINGTDELLRPIDYDMEEGRRIICPLGLKYNATFKRCDDINECEMNQLACAQDEICRNTLGGYDCIPVGCPRGFVLVNELCQDVDECEQNLHSCATHERCQNTNGSFTCEPPRTTRPPPVTDPPVIPCRKGYKIDNETKECVDIDECVEGPGCRDHERCSNLPGNFDCSPLCGPGWYFQFHTKTCEDVDECLLGHHNCRQRTHYCKNTNGSYSCELLSPCSAGYRRNQEGNCVDVDECLESLHTCSRESHRYCVNRDGGYECITRLPSCARGYEYSLLSHQCEDIDECRPASDSPQVNVCQGLRCVNLPGSYRCEALTEFQRSLVHQKKKPACPTGYSYDPNLRRCSDIDECADGTHNCGLQRCYNLPGSFHCAKLPRPILNRKTTVTKIPTTKSGPGYNCIRGFKYNKTLDDCVDVNECLEVEGTCTSSEECSNTIGSYKCNCLPGFRRDEYNLECIDINECQLQNKCLSSQRCDNTIGSYTCVRFLPCGTGYTLNAATEICEDDDECALGTHDCIKGYNCRNTMGSYRCDRDRSVMKFPTKIYTTTTKRPTTLAAYTTDRTTTLKSLTTTTATPDLTAAKNNNNTTENSLYTIQKTTPAEIIPTVGSLIVTASTPNPKVPFSSRPRVNCPRGYESGPQGQCIDIDECHRNLRMCGNQRCVNTIGSFKCEAGVSCGAGYAPDPVTGHCKDIDECTNGTHKCGRDQKCENRQGGYVCFCPPGFEIGSNNDCVDIDECTRVLSGRICGTAGNGKCLNTPGSYRCICEPGFENDPKTGTCRDLDECQNNPNQCQQECYNTWGGYKCACQYGYRLRADNRTCEDIDECTEFKDNNLCVGICDNTPGSYACRCPDGYTLGDDGRTCQDVDECVTKDVCKATGETCQNLRGSYRCNKMNCPPGYVQDPQRKNRCVRENQFCAVTDKACFQKPAHYTFNYISIVSMYPIPTLAGQVELFTMRGAYNLPGSTVHFNLAFIRANAPPHVIPATEEFFALRRPFPAQAVLVMTKSIQGPQDIELEFSMEIYGPKGEFAGSAVAKIYIIVTQYEF